MNDHSSNNITLIGMPGAGKSTIGIVLAKVLGLDFLDSDLLIQKEEGRLLWQIIRDEGSDGFARIEERVNSSIQVQNAIIATGGSVVYSDKAMQELKYTGLSRLQKFQALGNAVNVDVVELIASRLIKER